MVQSNGTRSESQWFRIDFTGKKKYSGLAVELRFVSAAGEFAARRAMPTSGTGGACRYGGGQSAEGLSRPPTCQPVEPWARVPASGFGSWASEQKGRKRTAGRRTGRLGRSRDDERGRTGDIAHLEQHDCFAFSSLCQVLSLFLRHRRIRILDRNGFAFSLSLVFHELRALTCIHFAGMSPAVKH